MNPQPTVPLEDYKQQRALSAVATHQARIKKLTVNSLRARALGCEAHILNCALCTNPPPPYLTVNELLGDTSLWIGGTGIFVPKSGGKPVDYLLCPSCSEWIESATPEEKQRLFVKIETGMSAEVTR
jgi:hypothetical protein